MTREHRRYVLPCAGYQLGRRTGPVDWDQESYCIEGCGNPATHRRLVGMVDDVPLYEMICCEHAVEAT